eukprot:scaffold9616_cov93-Skeletonema_dohrnii-CCMP3373.AAC.2
MVASYGSTTDDRAAKSSQLTDLYEEASVLASETNQAIDKQAQSTCAAERSASISVSCFLLLL